jgi:hypothetical protein
MRDLPAAERDGVRPASPAGTKHAPASTARRRVGRRVPTAA